MNKIKNIKKHKLTYWSLFIFSIFPVFAFAVPLTGLAGLLTAFGGLLNTVIQIVFGLALIFFFWGTGQFILNANDAKTRDEGKKKMLWGVIALFVMISIYGILALIGNLIGVQPSGAPIFQGDAIPGTPNV
jgi:hypothetical protein